MTVPIPPIGLPEVSQQAALPKSDGLQSLAQRFEQVLAQMPPETQTHTGANSGPSPLGQAMASFDKNYLDASANLQHLNQQAGSMDFPTFHAASLQVMQQMGMSQAYFQVGSSLVTSGKGTLTTLLKSA